MKYIDKSMFNKLSIKEQVKIFFNQLQSVLENNLTNQKNKIKK